MQSYNNKMKHWYQVPVFHFGKPGRARAFSSGADAAPAPVFLRGRCQPAPVFLWGRCQPGTVFLWGRRQPGTVPHRPSKKCPPPARRGDAAYAGGGEPAGGQALSRRAAVGGTPPSGRQAFFRRSPPGKLRDLAGGLERFPPGKLCNFERFPPGQMPQPRPFSSGEVARLGGRAGACTYNPTIAAAQGFAS